MQTVRLFFIVVTSIIFILRLITIFPVELRILLGNTKNSSFVLLELQNVLCLRYKKKGVQFVL